MKAFTGVAAARIDALFHRLDLAFGVDLPSQWALYGSAGLVWTHSALGVGMFDAMMLGQWPFFIDLGVSRRF